VVDVGLIYLGYNYHNDFMGNNSPKKRETKRWWQLAITFYNKIIMNLQYCHEIGILYNEHLLVPIENILSVSETINNKTFIIISYNDLAIINLPGFSIICKLECYKFSEVNRTLVVVGRTHGSKSFYGLSNRNDLFEFGLSWTIYTSPRFWTKLNYQLILFGEKTFTALPLIEENG
jgi:hypothetical protein